MILALWQWLFMTTMASSAAIVLVMILRRPLRHLVGSRAAYWLWLLPMGVLLACLLPMPASPFGMAWILADVNLLPRPDVGIVDTGSGFNSVRIGVTAWLLGCAAMAVCLLLAQRRLWRKLGKLSLQGDGTWRAQCVPKFGPAVIGLWPARIVLPLSFAVLWSPRQQAQVLAHERCHVQRRDLWAQLLALGWLCLFWFNPIVHRAVRMLRVDQELACDATVVARQPTMVRDYAEALLVTAQHGIGAPLCSPWNDLVHIRQRMGMLGRSVRGRSIHRFGITLIVVMALLCGASAWSMQGGNAGSVSVDSGETLLVVDIDFRLLGAAAGGDSGGQKLRLLVHPNEQSVVSSDDPVNPWRLSLQVSPAAQGYFTVATSVTIGDRLVAAPAIVVLPDMDASIEISDLMRLELRVSPLTFDNDPRAAAGVTDRQ